MSKFPVSMSRKSLKDVIKHLGKKKVAEILTNPNDFGIVIYWVASPDHTMGKAGEKFLTDYMGVKKALSRSYYRLRRAAEDMEREKGRVRACSLHHYLEPAEIRCSTGVEILRCKNCYALFHRPVRDDSD